MELTPELVDRYLDGLAPRSAAGRRGYCATCPLARVLGKAGARSPVVWHRNYMVGDFAHEVYFPLPDWAKKFIKAVDGSGIPGSRISAQRARRIMNEVR